MGTTNFELIEMVQALKIPHFRGVIMKDEFKSLDKSLPNECGIYNLNDSGEAGSHWCAWFKNENDWFHFCSFGGDPCLQLREYAKPNKITTHTFKLQMFEDTCCVEYCLLVLYLCFYKKLSYYDVILSLYNLSKKEATATNNQESK